MGGEEVKKKISDLLDETNDPIEYERMLGIDPNAPPVILPDNEPEPLTNEEVQLNLIKLRGIADNLFGDEGPLEDNDLLGSGEDLLGGNDDE